MVSDLVLLVWRTPPISTNDVFESILTFKNQVVLTIVKSDEKLRFARIYSLESGKILWDTLACGSVGSVNVKEDKNIVGYLAIRECVDNNKNRFFDIQTGEDVTDMIGGFEKEEVDWFAEDQGAGTIIKGGNLKWSSFKNELAKSVDLFSYWDAKFSVGNEGTVLRHEGIAHVVDSVFVATGNEVNAVDTVVLLSEFGSVFGYDLMGNQLWVVEIEDKMKGDKCSFVGRHARYSAVVFCVNEKNRDTRVNVISAESGASKLVKKLHRYEAVHAYAHERCCSNNDSCIMLVNNAGERQLVSTCEKEYIKISGMEFDDTLFISARRGGQSVNGFTNEKNPTWRFQLPEGMEIENVAVKQEAHSVARRRRLSRVRVTEDRKLLWKHIDGTVMLVLAKHEEKVDGGAMAVVIDGNSGAVMKAMNHVNASAPFTAVAHDNWFVYSFWNTYLLQQELHVIDMYEAKDETSFIVRKAIDFARRHFPSFLDVVPGIEDVHDTEGTCDASGTCDARRRKAPGMVHSAFLISHQVKILQHSETEAGITESSVVLGLTNGQVVSLSRLAVDARRPREGGYASAESLVPYYPYISFLPSESAAQFVTSDVYVTGLKGVRVAPVWRRESSCHVFVYGVDLYYRLLQPAGSFDMLPHDFRFLTVAVSIAAILFSAFYSRNAVESKILHDAWYNL